MRPEGWFLIACIKNHGINPAQYCRLKCIKAAKREPSTDITMKSQFYYFYSEFFAEAFLQKRPENPP